MAETENKLEIKFWQGKYKWKSIKFLRIGP